MRSAQNNWDFWTLLPETFHQTTVVMSDRGIPSSFRHMHFYGEHTFSFYNEKNERVWCKFHFKTQQGIKNLTDAEAEQAAFTPAHVVPGIGFSPDKFFQGRLFVYGDAQRYRLGVNYNQIPVNRPKVEVHDYHRDGLMRTDGNYGGAPAYSPNTARNIEPVTENVKYRHAVHCYWADPAYGERITAAMGLDSKFVSSTGGSEGKQTDKNSSSEIPPRYRCKGRGESALCTSSF